MNREIYERAVKSLSLDRELSEERLRDMSLDRFRKICIIEGFKSNSRLTFEDTVKILNGRPKKGIVGAINDYERRFRYEGNILSRGLSWVVTKIRDIF